ncbi:MAG: fasciclin domain-containing protein [Candidatus Kapabacteria bacterium]|nr:fasciclin domain-containing protein [Candidatus Kapabacteria bacterium]
MIRRIVSSALVLALALALTTTAFAQGKKDIVETAVAAGSFKTLATALTEAGLIETLKGKGPFTVFAPTDAAFAKIPADKLAALLKDKEALKKVLLYHVVSGKVEAKTVLTMNGKGAKTVEGSEAMIKVEGKTVMVDGAKVEKTDIGCSNGVIHVIDTVIMPKN